MPIRLAAQWSLRAVEAREEAARLNDPKAKRTLLLLAAGYDRLAEYAASIERSGLPHEAKEVDFTD
jgi:hypothetical protein